MSIACASRSPLAEKRAITAKARAAAAENGAKSHALLIEKLKFTIAKLRHLQFGQSAERGAILEQLELQLAGLEENAARAQADRAAAAADVSKVGSFQRKRPARRPLPDDLPRERLVHPSAPKVAAVAWIASYASLASIRPTQRAGLQPGRRPTPSPT